MSSTKVSFTYDACVGQIVSGTVQHREPNTQEEKGEGMSSP